MQALDILSKKIDRELRDREGRDSQYYAGFRDGLLLAKVTANGINAQVHDTGTLLVGQEVGNLEYWAACSCCTADLCVYQPATDAGRIEAERIMEEDLEWFYADGWLCPACH